MFILLVVGLLTWRLWPQSLSFILPDDADSFPNVSAVATVNVFEVGQVDFLHYKLEDEGSYAAKDLMDILNTSGYRPSFRNLLPWNDGSLVSGNDYDGRSVNLDFYLADGQNFQSVSVHFLGRSLVSIYANGRSGVYHATNPDTLTTLVEYIQTHDQPTS